jgi:hypothetical protein
MSQNGKGSKPRPLSVSYNKYADNFDDIFHKTKVKSKAIIANPNWIVKINIIPNDKNKPLQDKPTKKDKQK